MAKSPDAFRTISEVADWLGIQAHVLRFWESKFSQVKPIKRAGGRRYYRPTDMLLLGGIKKLLHDDGLTIKGVQKILREEGMSHVAELSQPLDDTTLSQIDDAPAEQAPEKAAPEPAEDTGVVLSFEARAEEDAAPDPEEAEPAPVDTVMEETPAAAPEELPEAVDSEPAPLEAQEESPEDVAEDAAEAPDPVPVDAEPESAASPAPPEHTPQEEAPADIPQPSMLPDEDAAEVGPAFIHRAIDTPRREEPPAAPPEETTSPAATLPAFLRRPLTEETAQETEETAAEAAEPTETASAPKPRMVDVGPLPPEDAPGLTFGTLTAAYRTKALGPSRAAEIAPLLARLSTLRDAMNARRRNAGNTTPDS